jgi:hypothetical protein
MIRTIENLLGLPPMNVNDAYAPLMSRSFSGSGKQPPFSADTRNLTTGLLYKTNPHSAAGAKESSRMDFSRPDAADAHVLNTILWRDRKGSTPLPTSLRRPTATTRTDPDD